MMSADQDILYLHGGPGLNGSVERAWFANQSSSTHRVDWWDQPSAPPAAPSALEFLTQSAAVRLSEMAQRRNGPVTVVSHSAASVIAARLCAVPGLPLREVVMVNPVFDLMRAFRNLARRLVDVGMGTAALAEAYAASTLPQADLFALIGAVGEVPERFRLYWAPGAEPIRDRYLALAPTGPELDLATFGRAALEIQDARNGWATLVPRCPISAVVGKHDPMIDDGEDDHLRALLPGLRLTRVDAGHMAIFEQPPAVWLSGG